jgi:hypothetical protein
MVSKQNVSILDQENMWGRKHEVRTAHRQEIVSRGNEIDGDNEDFVEVTSSLAIRPAMAERDWKTGQGVAKGVRRDRRDGVPNARGDHGSAEAGRPVTEGRSRRACGTARQTCRAEDDVIVDGGHEGCDCSTCKGTNNIYGVCAIHELVIHARSRGICWYFLTTLLKI